MKVRIIGNVTHDGEDLQKGALVVMPDAQAAALVGYGEAEQVSDEQPEETPEAFDIYKASKKALNDYAVLIGIDPAAFSARSELIEAVKKVQDGSIAPKE